MSKSKHTPALRDESLAVMAALTPEQLEAVAIVIETAEAQGDTAVRGNEERRKSSAAATLRCLAKEVRTLARRVSAFSDLLEAFRVAHAALERHELVESIINPQYRPMMEYLTKAIDKAANPEAGHNSPG